MTRADERCGNESRKSLTARSSARRPTTCSATSNLRALRRLRRQLAGDVATTAEIFRTRHPYRAPSVCQTEIDPRLLRGFCRLKSAVFLEMSPRQVLPGRRTVCSTNVDQERARRGHRRREDPSATLGPHPTDAGADPFRGRADVAAEQCDGLGRLGSKDTERVVVVGYRHRRQKLDVVSAS
jgi:hypothetical protein